MPRRHRIPIRLIAVIGSLVVVSVFTVSAMAAVSGTLHPYERSVLPENTVLPTAVVADANSGTGATPAPSDAASTSTGPEAATQPPSDSPIVTLAPPSFWHGEDWVPPTPEPTPPPPPTPTLAPTDVPPSGAPDTFTPGYPSGGNKGGGAIQVVDGLRAVLVVGPSGETKTNIVRANEFAAKAASYGMQVTKIYAPCATWEMVRDAAQGANLVAYWGHGNGWPSPYGSGLAGETTKDGMGLSYYCNDTSLRPDYKGAKLIREQIRLAPNSVVVLSHLCYSAGNAEPGFPIPSPDVAKQRIDNHANGWLSAGAKAVFAYASGDAAMILDGLFKGTRSLDDVFEIVGRERRPYYGFVGFSDYYEPSSRVPGNTIHIDPGVTEGYLRAITGDLSYTTDQWRGTPTQ